MFKQVTIMGPGLLGASLVLAVKKKLLAEKIVVWARSENTAKNALEKLPVDQVERKSIRIGKRESTGGSLYSG